MIHPHKRFLTHYSFIILGFFSAFLVFAGCGGKPEAAKEPAAGVPENANSENGTQKEEKAASDIPAAPDLPGLSSFGEDTQKLPDVPAFTDEELNIALAAFMKRFQDDPLVSELEEAAKGTYYFIRALQLKDDKVVLALLSDVARDEWRKHRIALGPANMAEMLVEFAGIQYLHHPDTDEVVGARVGMLWSFDEVEDQVVCVMRKESSGEWRVAGMATVIREDLPPVVFDFEDMERMQEMLKNTDQEMKRRLDAGEVPK